MIKNLSTFSLVDYLTPDYISRQVSQALAEDLGTGDVTAALLPTHTTGKAILLSKEPGVFCGQAWLTQAFQQVSTDINCQFHLSDGMPFSTNQPLVEIQGPIQAIVTAERTALNFVQLLSGTATTTAAYVAKLQGTKAKLYDTRKTIPGLRLAQKYAVQCGGGHNHRLGLWDAILLKENHLSAFASPAEAVLTAKSRFPQIWVEIEVENLAQLENALSANPDRILLDNFSLTDIQAAVAITNSRCPLEVSGNVSLESIQTIAACGVDVISCGALTKHLRAIDLSLRF